MQHSESETRTEPPQTAENGDFTLEALASRVNAALDIGDHEAAGALLHEAGSRFPDDSNVLKLLTKQRRQAERFSRVYSLLKEAHEKIDEDKFVDGLGAFREASNLSHGFFSLEEAVFQVAVDEGEQLGARNWRIATALYEDVARFSPKLAVPEHLWLAVKAAEREEVISGVLAETALPKPAELDRAQERLQRTLERYPDDAGLANRLKSIESTLDEKRRWDDRHKRLKKMADLRDAMQREEDASQLGKYRVSAESLAGDHGAEPEFQTIVEDIKNQIVSAEKASSALAQDRIDDCLEECAWVLSRMRHHQLFLNLKKQAEDRELALVDEYSDAVTRIKDLLVAGKLPEADRLCSKALARLPQFADLKELSQEIQLRKSQEDRGVAQNVESARRLVERGEASLRSRQFKVAEQSFVNALKLVPDDKNLAEHIDGILHQHARAMAAENGDLAEETLKIGQRIIPGWTVPADITESLQKRRELTKEESARWSALDSLGSLDAQLKLAKTRGEVSGIREKVESAEFSAAKHADVREAAADLLSQMDERVAAIGRREARRPAIIRAISIAAAVILGVGLSYWLNNRSGIPVPAKPRAVETTRSAKPAAPAPVAPSDDAPMAVQTADLEPTLPKPAVLEIRGADPRSKIKLDGELLAKASKALVFSRDITPGTHSLEISRNGYLSKTITRELGPGQVLALEGADLQLDSSDARTLASRQPDTRAVRRSGIRGISGASIGGDSSKVAANRPKPDMLEWQAVDKNNADALRTFAAKYPASPLAGEAKKETDKVLVATALKGEESEWNRVDHASKTALEEFLKNHPSSRFGTAATGALAELDRKRRQLEMQDEEKWKKVSPRDEASLESYLRENPSGRYRSQAELSLATLRLGRNSGNETNAVLTVISRFANAWNQKDVDSILAIQRNLSRHAVKAQLSQVREISMRISPASPPQIEGSQAVVLCRRQALQVFSDGTRKQIPESIVSYVLTKRNGTWLIEETR